MNTMNATTKYPATVHGLFNMAVEMGVEPSELLPPEGFIQAKDALQPELLADYFDGPSEAGDGWRIETTFTLDRGVTFEILAPDLSVITMLTASQAVAAGKALARLATKYA